MIKLKSTIECEGGKKVIFELKQSLESLLGGYNVRYTIDIFSGDELQDSTSVIIESPEELSLEDVLEKDCHWKIESLEEVIEAEIVEEPKLLR